MNTHSLDPISAPADTLAVLTSPHDVREGSPEHQLNVYAFAADFLSELDAEPGIGAWWPI